MKIYKKIPRFSVLWKGVTRRLSIMLFQRIPFLRPAIRWASEKENKRAVSRWGYSFLTIFLLTAFNLNWRYVIVLTKWGVGISICLTLIFTFRKRDTCKRCRHVKIIYKEMSLGSYKRDSRGEIIKKTGLCLMCLEVAIPEINETYDSINHKIDQLKELIELSRGHFESDAYVIVDRIEEYMIDDEVEASAPPFAPQQMLFDFMKSKESKPKRSLFKPRSGA